MRTSEWIVVLYFLYLTLTAALASAAVPRRRGVVVRALLAAAAPAAVAAWPYTRTSEALRDWLPLAFLLIGYWLPARLSGEPNPRVERWLQSFDDRWVGTAPQRFALLGPRVAIELLELAYLFCYPLMPIGFAWLTLHGWRGDADRFWTSVLLAGFCCYGVLPWLPTRPPRALERQADTPRSTIRRMNLVVLRHGSVTLNTFPSGHVATSLATALAVLSRLPVDGAVFVVVALMIAVGSVVGRYHYAADAFAGLLVGMMAFAVSRLV